MKRRRTKNGMAYRSQASRSLVKEARLSPTRIHLARVKNTSPGPRTTRRNRISSPPAELSCSAPAEIRNGARASVLDSPSPRVACQKLSNEAPCETGQTGETVYSMERKEREKDILSRSLGSFIGPLLPVGLRVHLHAAHT